MKKIIVIGPGLSMGGVERAISNTLNSMTVLKPDNEYYFISIFKKETFFSINSDIQFYEPKGFNVEKLSLLSTIFYLNKIVSDLYSENKDIKVLVFGKFYGALTSLALLNLKIDIFISERQSPLHKLPFKLRIINWLAFSLRPPQGVMAQTSIAAEYQQKYYKKSKIKVIPNVLREVVLYPEIERQQVVLAVGRLGDHLKGFDLLIESFALVKNKQWELHIAGGDEDGADLKEQAKRLGVFDRIRFLGKVQDIDKAYAKAGIYVIPSRSEGFPNALAEAMAAGCACVAFDFIAGPSDIIEDGVTGIIVENGNIQKMAETIDWLIEYPEKRMQLGKEAMNLRKRLHKET